MVKGDVTVGAALVGGCGQPKDLVLKKVGSGQEGRKESDRRLARRPKRRMMDEMQKPI